LLEVGWLETLSGVVSAKISFSKDWNHRLDEEFIVIFELLADELWLLILNGNALPKTLLTHRLHVSVVVVKLFDLTDISPYIFLIELLPLLL
jgi:hypothetical protein